MNAVEIYTVTAGSIGLITGIILLFSKAFNYYMSRNPWVMYFTFDPVHKSTGPQEFHKTLKIPPGQHKVNIQLYVRRPTTLSWVSIQPKAKKSILPLRRNVFNDPAIEVLDVRDVTPWISGNSKTKGTRADDYRGRWIIFEPGAEVPKEYYLWFELKLEAPGEWQGDIGFSNPIDGKRRFVYRRVVVSSKYSLPSR